MKDIYVKKLSVAELIMLSELFEYNDIENMLADYSVKIEEETIDIFGLFHNSALIGELRAMYQSEDLLMTVKGKRVYLYAFRIHKEYQGKGLGKYLLEYVLRYLLQKGYSEFTVGVEDWNERALHIYKKYGFDEILERKKESYQGTSYEYNLYLKR